MTRAAPLAPLTLRPDSGNAPACHLMRGGLAVAAVYGPDREEDARLFAASPEMHGALWEAEQLLQAVLDAAPPSQPDQDDYDDDTEGAELFGCDEAAWEAARLARPVLERIRAAIAKAKGTPV